MREIKCPSCGRTVLLDDVKRETHHEAPMCDGWRELVGVNGGKPAGALIVTDQGSERVEPLPHGWRSGR